MHKNFHSQMQSKARKKFYVWSITDQQSICGLREKAKKEKLLDGHL